MIKTFDISGFTQENKNLLQETLGEILFAHGAWHGNGYDTISCNPDTGVCTIANATFTDFVITESDILAQIASDDSKRGDTDPNNVPDPAP